MSAVTTIFDKVKLKVNNWNLEGTVRYIGEVEGEIGIFYGIELEKPWGNNDGTWNNKCYFNTTSNKGLFIKKHQIISTVIDEHSNIPRCTVGQIIYVPKYQCNAIIRFIGELKVNKHFVFSYGVQLEEQKGDNNGTWNGIRYFQCAPQFAVFLTQEDFKINHHHQPQKKKNRSFKQGEHKKRSNKRKKKSSNTKKRSNKKKNRSFKENDDQIHQKPQQQPPKSLYDQLADLC